MHCFYSSQERSKIQGTSQDQNQSTFECSSQEQSTIAWEAEEEM